MRLRLLGFCAALALVTLPLSAHPHVWVEAKAEVTIAAGYVEGVWATWSFDDVFSQLILADFPADASGKFDAKTNAGIKKGYFDNLKTYQYFSHFVLGKKDLDVPQPQKFQASTTPDGKVIYRFFVPLAVRLDAQTPLCVSFYDDTFFTDMIFDKKNPVTLTVTDGGNASFAFKPDKSKTFYGGQITPTFAAITWSPR
jgi:ABC-type uncharacterized transport system substrate-binding protein